MKRTEEKSFIHLFKTPLGFYFYDVNTGKIVKVDQDVYEYLEQGSNQETESVIKKIELLKNAGYLKSSRVRETEHPSTQMVPFLLNSKVGNMILQVTQNCNLRCDYCVYSGNYHTRGHSNKRMSFDTAKNSIDFLIKHSKEKNNIYLGFYGGEPLLEFELIKKCVQYANKVSEGKNIKYSMTTNGTLLTDKVIDFLIEHDFWITISLDGPKEIHNRSRHFWKNDEGSYDVIINNINKIRQKSEEFYSKNVKFSTVILTEGEISCIDTFFKGEEIFSDSFFSTSFVSNSYVKEEHQVTEEFIKDQEYEVFKLYLWLMKRLEEKEVSMLLRQSLNQLMIVDKRMRETTREQLPEKWHRGGPCIPGISRIFVTVEGDLLPCEKVCEISDLSKIGNLEDGFDYESVLKILNIERVTEEQCHNCWAYMECTSCIRVCDEKESNIKNSIYHECERIKNNLDSIFKNYTVLKEVGYDFDEYINTNMIKEGMR